MRNRKGLLAIAALLAALLLAVLLLPAVTGLVIQRQLNLLPTVTATPHPTADPWDEEL